LHWHFATVGVYDENTVNTNTVETVAAGNERGTTGLISARQGDLSWRLIF